MAIRLSQSKSSLGIIAKIEGSVPFVDANGDLIEDNPNLFWDDANDRLGIGVADPDAKLEINGQIKITGGNPANSRYLRSDANGLATWGDVGWTDLGTDVVLLVTSNNVGIGTATPNAKLDVGGTPGTVVGGFASGQLHVTGQSADVNANAVITGHNLNGGNKQLWYLGSTASANDNIGFINRQNAALSLSTNSLTRMTIDNLGNIGIGLSSPDVLTHIQASVSANRAIETTAQLVVEKNDNASIQIITPATKKGALHFGDAISDVGGIVYDHNTDDMIIRTAGVDRVTIDNGGNVVHNNFTKLGSDAPVVKMKKLTGTTGATEGSTTDIAHGLTLSKIIGLSVLVTADNSNLIPPGLVFTAEFEYDTFLDPTNVKIRLSNTNSGTLLGNAITVLLTYEE